MKLPEARHRGPWLLALLSGLLAACAATPRPAPALPYAAPPVDARWQAVCYQFAFGDTGEPVWAADLLVAHELLAPALAAQGEAVGLWRVHRRAAQDVLGHQFSVLFFTGEQSGAALRAALTQAPLLEELRRAGRLRELVADCSPGAGRDSLAGRSDGRWDYPLQAAWPYFIMGVSASWLALIDAVGAEMPAPGPSLNERLVHYRRIDEAVKGIWHVQGQHAFLHHLSAVYGYEALRINTYMDF